MFGDIPATGFFIRHARNVEMTNVEVALDAPDPRPAFRVENVDGADFFRVKAPGQSVFSLKDVRNFALSGSGRLKDRRIAGPTSGTF